MENNIYLSVIIPAYNEEKRIGPTMTAVAKYFKYQKFVAELIVVNDGSRDNTVQVVESFRDQIKELRIIDYRQNKGKGFAVRNGALQARGEFILFTDADNSTDITEFDKCQQELWGGYDIVIGSRALPESKIMIHQPWYREVTGRLANKLIKILTGLPYQDTQCGFKCFSRKAALIIFKQAKIDRWAFDVEALVLARKNGFKIKEMPINWRNDSSSKVSLGGYLKTLRELIKIRRIYKKEGESSKR